MTSFNVICGLCLPQPKILGAPINWRFFFGERLRLCSWSLALALSIAVLGLERFCPQKGCLWPWPRIFFVSLASSLVFSTPPLSDRLRWLDRKLCQVHSSKILLVQVRFGFIDLKFNYRYSFRPEKKKGKLLILLMVFRENDES